MAIKKTDVYNFLEAKQNEVIRAKAIPLKEKWNQLKDEHYNKLVGKSGVLTEEFKTSAKNLKETLVNLRDNLDYHGYNLNDLIRLLSKAQNGEKYLYDNISYNNVTVISQAEDDYKNCRREIMEEFSKIRSAVKATKSGKQAYKLVKDLGFDVSTLVASERGEIMTLNVNKALVGLPEVGVKSEG